MRILFPTLIFKESFLIEKVNKATMDLSDGQYTSFVVEFRIELNLVLISMAG